MNRAAVTIALTNNETLSFEATDGGQSVLQALTEPTKGWVALPLGNGVQAVLNKLHVVSAKVEVRQ